MSEQQQDASRGSLPWWVQLCRWLKARLLYAWGTLIVGIIVSTIANLNTTTTDTPLSRLFLMHLVLTFPIPVFAGLGALLLLTLLSLAGSRERDTAIPHTLSEQNRTHMLRRLRWRYEQMMAQSLQGAVQVELGLASRPTAVQNAASLFLRLPDQPEQLLPAHTSIVQAYELAQHELLILGEPGAGKSTFLLELAHHLIEQAEQDVTQPLPLLLPLSSWATNRRPLQEWMIEQVALLYDVPRNLSQQWIQASVILPLLDGLDEVDESARAACIVAVNVYHRDHLQPLVVCSRTNEYEMAAKSERLALHTAVVVQPLSMQQVDSHLESLGKPLAALHSALKKNVTLQELATTPLMLQVLMLIYHGTRVRELSHKDAQLRQQIWTDYVQRMVERKGDAKCYPLSSTTTWLGWLAQQMRDHNQTIFYLEGLQPSWLPKEQRICYRCSIGLIFGLTFGLITGSIGGGGLVTGLIVGLIMGLVVQITTEDPSCSSKTVRSMLLLILPIVLISLGLFHMLNLLVWVLVGLSSGLLFGHPFLSKLSEGHLVLPPNEAIKHYVKSGLIPGLVIALMCGLTIWLLSSTEPMYDTREFLEVRSGWGTLSISLTTSSMLWLSFGLADIIRHYTLRFWLARSHLFPWKAVPFLEDATARILLRRVGGGYSFTHRLLLDHFANLDTAPPSPSTGVNPVQQTPLP